MKWINHVTTTTALAYFAGIHEPNLLGVSAFFSVFPDAIESPFGIRLIPNRTIIHSVLLWIIYFICLYNLNIPYTNSIIFHLLLA